MKRKIYYLMMTLLLLMGATVQRATAQEMRRPVDNQHPLWMVHVDVWNSADPQKIIDLIPADLKPFVCMNLSLSCQYDKNLNMYRMPRCAVRTWKSWASVCQQNGMWFTCQPASGGHTHIQDSDLETFEYFFKAYPNFLGWNYAEQFWGFDEAGDESSSTQASRLALFAKLIPMHHQYGGFLTISFCGNIWSHGLNPMGMMKRNSALLKACKNYPESILWLYKYTTSSCFYNNESVTFGPFIAGLATNYGVRYDNCGWNGATSDLVGENKCKYPGSAGIGTVMEQTCVNGGAVWDGPELIWTEDFQNLSNSTVDGYTRRNWGCYANFKGIWLDMWRQIIEGKMYIPTRAEVVGKTKIVVINNNTSGSDEDKYATWGTLYDNLYKQTDPFNKGNGQWMNNYLYLKKTGRYGTIPVVNVLYDDLAKSIPVQKKKSSVSSSWSKKVTEFNEQYPEVSKGDLYVNRYRNQLVTYTPYSYLNSKKSASAELPLLYNSCDSMKLTYGKLSSGLIREYADHIDLYLNNYRSDSTMSQLGAANVTDVITITGVTAEPSYTLTKHTGATGYSASATADYNAEAKTYAVSVKHLGPVELRINCTGAATSELTDALAEPEALPKPKQPSPFVGKIVIEAENMDYKSVKSVALTHSGWCAPDYAEFAGMGYVEMGTSTSAALKHQLKLQQAGDYDIYVRYCNTSKAGNLKLTVNGKQTTVVCEKVAKNDWRKVKVTATMKEGNNSLVITNTGGTGLTIDQVIYEPVGTEAERYLVSVRQASQGTVTPDVTEAAEGDTVHLTVQPKDGYRLSELRIINSVFYTMAKTIVVKDQNNVSFVMPDDNVTLQPVFVDNSAIYKLDFTSVVGGNMPPGWRCTQEDNAVHEYDNNYGTGARTMTGFSGYQGKAIYWRKVSAEYGRQANYRLSLEPSDYKLSFAMAAWKGTPKYKVSIINLATGSVLASTSNYTASPNANGNGSASLSSATKRTLAFTVTEAADYVIKFSNETGGDDLAEFLLLECSVNPVQSTDIAVTTRDQSLPAGIYSLSGVRLPRLQRGVNIVVSADGTCRRVVQK